MGNLGLDKLGNAQTRPRSRLLEIPNAPLRLATQTEAQHP